MVFEAKRDHVFLKINVNVYTDQTKHLNQIFRTFSGYNTDPNTAIIISLVNICDRLCFELKKIIRNFEIRNQKKFGEKF